jgi:hypothetical protein
MKLNVGGIDKNARIAVGVIVIAAGVYYQNIWGAVGVVPLLTGAFGFCPFYPLLGLSTKK